ncbi:MAG: hypothetical protein A2077_01465 [Nitrospirae bacterium GWC2_46_6]|nr:MAG: hypothetical protein A2077_01465 [Nitrospirae bacterium GWC2_46_6]
MVFFTSANASSFINTPRFNVHALKIIDPEDVYYLHLEDMPHFLGEIYPPFGGKDIGMVNADTASKPLSMR